VIFVISVCKIPIRKDNFTQRSQDAKQWTTTNPRVTQTESVLVTFAISVCKLGVDAAQVKRNALLAPTPAERQTPNAEMNVDVHLRRVFSRVAV
jgi:hypothetical protein